MAQREFHIARNFLRVLRERESPLKYEGMGCSPLAYFDGTGNDGLRISWARGVNKYEDLVDALRGTATIVGGDIFMSDNSNVPVMWPPNQSSGSNEQGMNLRKWLRKVRHYDTKGIMLHFHTADHLASAVKLVRRAAISGPKILSANCFQLSSNSPDPIKPKLFVQTCEDHCPGAILCLGWTDDIRFLISNNMEYSEKSLGDIIAFIRYRVTLSTHVMLSMHATILARSLSQVRELLHRMRRISLFVWTDEQNPVRDMADILAIRGSFANDFVFYAIPDAQLNGLE